MMCVYSMVMLDFDFGGLNFFEIKVFIYLIKMLGCEEVDFPCS